MNLRRTSGAVTIKVDGEVLQFDSWEAGIEYLFKEYAK